MSEKNNTIAQLEAMLFAAGDPVEPEKLADVLKLDIENVIKMLGYLEAKYDESGSGLRLIRVDGKYQICTREAYADGVRALLEIKKNTPLSPAAFEVLAIVAYNKAVTRSFVEQVRGVDCSGPISGLVQNEVLQPGVGIQERAWRVRGRLDLPGRPLVYGTTDRFLRCFSLNSLDDLPDLPSTEEVEQIAKDNGQTSLFEKEGGKDDPLAAAADALESANNEDEKEI